jgi:hypothetical protein
MTALAFPTSKKSLFSGPRRPGPKGYGRGRGRILAVKWGYNPNSSSLGVDVTFLLFGLFIITLLTPIVGLLLRFSARRKPAEG